MPIVIVNIVILLNKATYASAAIIIIIANEATEPRSEVDSAAEL